MKPSVGRQIKYNTSNFQLSIKDACILRNLATVFNDDSFVSRGIVISTHHLNIFTEGMLIYTKKKLIVSPVLIVATPEVKFFGVKETYISKSRAKDILSGLFHEIKEYEDLNAIILFIGVINRKTNGLHRISIAITKDGLYLIDTNNTNILYFQSKNLDAAKNMAKILYENYLHVVEISIIRTIDGSLADDSLFALYSIV